NGAGSQCRLQEIAMDDLVIANLGKHITLGGYQDSVGGEAGHHLEIECRLQLLQGVGIVEDADIRAEVQRDPFTATWIGDLVIAAGEDAWHQHDRPAYSHELEK